MGFRLVPKSVTLNGIMAIILRYLAQFGRFLGQFHTSGWLAVDLLFVSNKCHKVHQLSSKHDGHAVLFTVAELLVLYHRKQERTNAFHPIYANNYIIFAPLPSSRQHLSYDVFLEVRGEIIRTVLCCIVYWSCTQS